LTQTYLYVIMYIYGNTNKGKSVINPTLLRDEYRCACLFYFCERMIVMAGKILVLTPDDTVKTADYKDYSSINDEVHGLYEVFHEDKLPMIIGDDLDIVFFCNEEFLIRDDDEFNKINAVASLLSGQEIRGNVVIAVNELTDDGYDSRGFEYMEEDVGGGEIEEAICEHWLAEDTFLLFINQNADALKELHEKFDNNKSEPKITFIKD